MVCITDYLRMQIYSRLLIVSQSITLSMFLDMLVGGIRPHLYCLPILKSEDHRKALVEAATSGNPKFFLGTDSAPHATHTKEASCGCAGVFSANCCIEIYAQVFEEAGRLDRLEDFCSSFGADHYGLPRNTDFITLEKKSWTVPKSYKFGEHIVTPLKAGEEVLWTIVEDNSGKCMQQE